MKNRVLNGIVMSFHAMGFWIAAAVILRMIIAVAKVFEIGNEIHYRDTFGDEYSVIFLFAVGFLSYRKHTGLSSSVNLSPYKMILSLTLASLCVAMMFVLFDMTIVKQYFGTLDDSDITSTYWEELFPHGQLSGQLFSANGALSFFKLTLIYQTFILTGYCTKHVFSTTPKLLIMWVLAAILAFICAGEMSQNSFSTFIILLTCFIFIAGIILASPMLFSVFLILFCTAEEISLSLVMSTLIWLASVASTARLTKKYRVALPQEKRKDLTL